ncbi:MAG: ATP-binding cassette domain-containing protein, partial [Mesorhizobium sp.]
LSVRNLSISVGPSGKRIVDGLNFDLAPSDMLALVGESGSGKTMAARSIVSLLPAPLVTAPDCSIHFEGQELT